jgi:uncharacterized membrane protein
MKDLKTRTCIHFVVAFCVAYLPTWSVELGIDEACSQLNLSPSNNLGEDS